MPLDFIIVTRYNLRLKFKNLARVFDPLDPSWLEHRKQLFLEYCLPSIANQTDRDFLWFIFFQEGTHPDYIREICTLPNIRPIICNGGEFFGIIKNSPEYRNDFLCSVRLDNDDSLEKTFVEKTRETASLLVPAIEHYKQPMVVSYVNGVERDIATSNWYSRFYPSNAFIAVVESRKTGLPLHTCFSREHSSMTHTYKSMLIPNSDPMWCMNIHEKNAANIIKGTLRESAPSGF